MEHIEEKNRSHFMDLFLLAISDNETDPNEIELLYNLGFQKGFTKEQIDEIIANPHKVRFIKPTSLIEAIDRLYDLAQMVLADGIIHPNEIEYCKKIALRFQIIDKNIIDDLIENLIEEVKKGVDKETLINQIKKII